MRKLCHWECVIYRSILLKRITSSACASAQSRYVICKQSYSSEAKSPWLLYSAVCIQRAPVITQDKTPVESAFYKLIRQIEFEQSLKSDTELKHQEDVYLAKKLKDGDLDEDIDSIGLQTTQDKEDMYTEELNKFQTADRVTNEDRSGDKKSTKRCLDKVLYLVVKQTLGKVQPWILPMAVRQDGETLRQTCERAVGSLVGPDLISQPLGNAPVGFYKYKFPKAAGQNAGAKIFFFKSYYRGGAVRPDSAVSDYQWLTREELQATLQHEYFAAVSKFLVEEDLEPRAFAELQRKVPAHLMDWDRPTAEDKKPRSKVRAQ